MRQILFVDVDVLVETLSGHQVKQRPRDVKILPGADKAITGYYKRDWLIVGIGSQQNESSLEDAIEGTHYLLTLFPELESGFFCPDSEGRICCEVNRHLTPKLTYSLEHGERSTGLMSYSKLISAPNEPRSDFRKPNPGLILCAYHTLKIERHGKYKLADLTQCCMVSNSENKIWADNAGTKFIEAYSWRDPVGALAQWKDRRN